MTTTKMTPHPMRYHGPGWKIDQGNCYWLWAPRPDRDGWTACWQNATGTDGAYAKGTTAAEAMAAAEFDAEAIDAFLMVAE